MARDLNTVVIIGRLVRDPEIKYTTSGQPITKFSIANNTSYMQNNERKDYVNYFDINVWGNQAVNCQKFLKKGSQIVVEGHLRQNRWQDQATGKSSSKIEITANSVQFLTPISGQQSGGGQQQYNDFKPQTNNYNSNFQQNQNKSVNLNPWNDEDAQGGGEFYDDSFVDNGFNGSDDDIPF